MRHNALRLCVRDNAFDFGAYDALSTRITYAELQEIETVLCVEGDNRHTFQMWLPSYLKRKPAASNQRPVEDVFAELTGTSPIDAALVQRELVHVNESIDDTSKLLAGHRSAIATGGDGLTLAVVDVLNMQLDGLKNSKAALETQLDEAGAPHTSIEPYESTAVGPVQSGTLRQDGR